MNPLQSLIRFAITFVIVGILLYILGFIVALVMVSVAILLNRSIAYYKKHKRFSDWEFTGYAEPIRHTINRRLVLQKVKEFKRLDRRLNVWETKLEKQPINQIHYTGKADRNTTLEDIFKVHHNL